MTTPAPPPVDAPRPAEEIIAVGERYARDAAALGSVEWPQGMRAPAGLPRHPVSRYVQMAAQRHLRDIETRTASGEDLIWQPMEGAEFCRFAEHFQYLTGPAAGRRIRFTPYEVFLFLNLYGWRFADGTRRFRWVYDETARKNNKTGRLALAALWHLVAPMEGGARVYLVGAKEEHSRIPWQMARDFAKSHPGFRARFGVRPLTEVIEADAALLNRDGSQRTQGQLFALTSSPRGIEGKNPSAIFYTDAMEHRDAALQRSLEDGMGARREPLIYSESTGGDDRSTRCWANRSMLIDVLEGRATGEQADRTFGLIASADEERLQRRWSTPEAIAVANPLAGHTVRISDLQAEAVRAKREGEDAVARFKQVKLGCWESGATGAIFVSAGFNDLERLPPGVRLYDAHRPAPGRKMGAVYGLDLSSVSDFTAVVLEAPLPDGRIGVVARTLCPRRALERERENAGRLAEWIKAGHLIATEGEAVDKEDVQAALQELMLWYRPDGLGYDPAHGGWVGDFMREVVGTPRDCVRAWSQKGAYLSPGVEMVKANIRHRRYLLETNPCFDQQVRDSIFDVSVLPGFTKFQLRKLDQSTRARRRVDATAAWITGASQRNAMLTLKDGEPGPRAASA